MLDITTLALARKYCSGGGSTEGNTKPDWNQNDTTASDYIKNRPFYDGALSFEWDGNTTGKTKVVVDAFGTDYYKISDAFINRDKYSFANVCLFYNGISMEESYDLANADDIVEVADGWGCELFIFIQSPTEYAGATFSEPGLYVAFSDENTYMAKLSFPDLKKIDLKYLTGGVKRIGLDISHEEIHNLQVDNILPIINLGLSYDDALLIPSNFTTRTHNFSAVVGGNDDSVTIYSISSFVGSSSMNKSSIKEYIPVLYDTGSGKKSFSLQSSTPGSAKMFRITVDDTGTISTTEV